MISHFALKIFNFLSKYAVFSYSHSCNVLAVSLSLENVVNTFKKQWIFCSENSSSVYLIFSYQKNVLGLEDPFQKLVSDICPTTFTPHRTSSQTVK